MRHFIAVAFLAVFAFTGIDAQNRVLPSDTTVVTNHTTTINGTKISYTATTGTQPVWDESGKAVASLFYTYYKRSNAGKMSDRPLLISFNGGPGSASVWMHIAYTGPMVLNIDEEGYPRQPYGVHENPSSILDVADIVFVNPVNTGYSRPIRDDSGEKGKNSASSREAERKRFFGINADIKYLADWLNTFVTRQDRWLSPKYLIGESYGGTRVSGLALELQEKQWMYLNGVILVSPADYNFFNSDPAISSALNLPYFTAAAWYQKALPSALQQKDLLEILPEAENYALDVLMPAVARGGSLSQEEKKKIAEKNASRAA